MAGKKEQAVIGTSHKLHLGGRGEGWRRSNSYQRKKRRDRERGRSKEGGGGEPVKPRRKRALLIIKGSREKKKNAKLRVWKTIWKSEREGEKVFLTRVGS